MRAFAGLLVAMLVASLLPLASQAAPPGAPSQVGERQAAASSTFNAVEIFSQEPHVLTPKATGGITADTTRFSAGVPQGTTVLFVIGGVVSAIDAAKGQWKIGSPPVFVYESAGTTITGGPAVGDTVTVVGKRTVSPGPIVAEFITKVNTPPQPAGVATVSTAFLFNGKVASTTGSSWTVAPPTTAAPVTFSILAGPGPDGQGPTTIEVGLGAGSDVTVEYVMGRANITPPAKKKANAVTALLNPAQVTTLDLPDGTKVEFPSGSLDNEAQIQAVVLSAQELSPGVPGKVIKGLDLLLYDLQGVQLGPTYLNGSAEIEIPLSVEDVKLIGKDPLNARVVYFDRTLQDWEYVESHTDLSRRVVVAEPTHMSEFALVIQQPAGRSLLWLTVAIGGLAAAMAALAVVLVVRRRTPKST
ncbi:MAG: hypothetical protein HY683_07300 [Chloroflexi bacterium]|nr:hypothetical protein [Chloroflexota bacterium]